MHLVSTINPLTKSLEDVPALLFCLNEHRMFLARKNTYQVSPFNRLRARSSLSWTLLFFLLFSVYRI